MTFPASLDTLQAAIETIMTATATIQRPVAGVWTTAATLPCSFAQAPILPQENASRTERLYIDDRWRFLFPAGSDVRFQDRIVVGARTFEVIQVPVGAREIYRLVITQELGA
jgi:hypothetical protein